ncbi:MAG TPA: signal peptide peptidase SppA [Spirochaetota bacterium]
MDKNRKILISIFAFLLISLLISIIQIYFTMDRTKSANGLSMPDSRPGIGVIRLYGAITMSGEQSFLGGGPGGADALVAQLDDMMNDNQIHAIVLRIDSPGGTVAATQEIFHKLLKVRKKNKIIVASMGDIAASGGYYSAAGCDYIMANPGTITASIGVIAAAPNLKGLFEKLGIRMNVIKSGKYKDILSSSRDMTDEEKKLLQDMIDSSYEQFLKDVSLGRNIPIDDIRPVADGRVMTGSAALECKLIDGLGTFEDAIAKAKELAKLPDDSPVFENQKSPLSEIFGSIQGKIDRNPLEAALKTQVMLPIEYRYQP